MKLLKDSVESGVNNDGSSYYSFDVSDVKRLYHVKVRKYTSSSKKHIKFETGTKNYVTKGYFILDGSQIEHSHITNFLSMDMVRFSYHPMICSYDYHHSRNFSLTGMFEAFTFFVKMNKKLKIVHVNNCSIIGKHLKLFRNVDPLDVSPNGYLIASLKSKYEMSKV